MDHYYNNYLFYGSPQFGWRGDLIQEEVWIQQQRQWLEWLLKSPWHMLQWMDYYHRLRSCSTPAATDYFSQSQELVKQAKPGGHPGVAAFDMKEMRDGEGTRTLGPDKLMHDPELQNLVTSSIPSPPYSNLSLINASVFDPIYSAHLLASLAASNPGTRFQLPIPVSLPVPAIAPGIYDYAATLPVNGLTANNRPTSAQLELLSSWVNEQNVNEERERGDLLLSANKTANNFSHNNNINHNNNTINSSHHQKNNKQKKRGTTHHSVDKANKRNKKASKSTECRKSDDNDSAIDMDIKPTILPMEKNSPVSLKKFGDGDNQVTSSIIIQGNNNNNNNNASKGTTHHQPQSATNRDKVFTCPVCNRCFGYKHVLQNHERTHTGEKPYFCNICDKRFTRDHHLKTHMRLHTGEKPYNCTHCDKQFVQVANLRRHLRVHTGERPYSCDLCSSRFSDSNQLKAHMLIHKGQKPYVCDGCDGQFRRRHHLAHHKCSLSPPSGGDRKGEEDSFNSPSPPGKRERKCRETRRIIRVAGLPVASVKAELEPFLPGVPEQTQPEDLSVSSGARLRSYSGSGGSSVSASPSPSGGSHGSLGPYGGSSSSEPADLYSDEERSGGSSGLNIKRESEEQASPSQG